MSAADCTEGPGAEANDGTIKYAQKHHAGIRHVFPNNIFLDPTQKTALFFFFFSFGRTLYLNYLSPAIDGVPHRLYVSGL